jgi:D-glycero-D-manno-heptose 1,7-bisphosphate phosphatase
VFLDRDGTINYTGRDGRPPRNGEGLQIIPGAVEAAKLLRERGFTLVIVTNQPEISRGTLPLGHVNRSNTQAQQAVGAVAVMTCSHDWRVQDCECRKPKPGMLLKAALAHNIDLTRSWIIGDKDTDVEAGLAAGAKGILLQANVPNELPRSLQPILWEEQHANLP